MYTRKMYLYYILISALIVCSNISAEDIRFPPDAGVFNVKDFGAKGDGIQDDTKALQDALDSQGGNKIIYLPNGTYLVTSTLLWPPKDKNSSVDCGSCHKRTIMQGQSRDGVIIKLKDACEGYGDTTQTKPVIWTGTAPAQRFRNSIRNLTVNTGKNNPGAIGIQFIANNTGSIRSVVILSEDLKGVYGLDMSYTGEMGPLYINDLTVKGFGIGIVMKYGVGVTMEFIQLSDQKVCGIRTFDAMFIRKLTSKNSVPAIMNLKNGSIVLIESELTEGNSKTAAILNDGKLFARNVSSSGYQFTIQESKGKMRSIPSPIVEDVSHSIYTQFPNSPQSSLNLTIKDPPTIAWEKDFSKWANPMNYGAKGDGQSNDREAIQKAIDDPTKTVLYLPFKKSWKIKGDVMIRGNINRVIGCEGKIAPNSDSGRFVFTEGTAPAVVFERIDAQYSNVSLVHASTRTLVMSSCSHFKFISEGTGDLFMEDVPTNPQFLKPGQRIWARQLNPESGEIVNVVNNGAYLWILGLKTEHVQTKILTKNKGFTEVLGGYIYATKTYEKINLFEIENSSASFAGISEKLINVYTTFPVFVKETRGEVIKELKAEEVSSLYMGLYSGYTERAPTLVIQNNTPSYRPKSDKLGVNSGNKIVWRAEGTEINGDATGRHIKEGKQR